MTSSTTRIWTYFPLLNKALHRQGHIAHTLYYPAYTILVSRMERLEISVHTICICASIFRTTDHFPRPFWVINIGTGYLTSAMNFELAHVYSNSEPAP